MGLWVWGFRGLGVCRVEDHEPNSCLVVGDISNFSYNQKCDTEVVVEKAFQQGARYVLS